MTARRTSRLPRKIAAAFVLAAATMTASCAVADASKVEFIREIYQTEIVAFARHEAQQGDFASLFSRPTQELLKATKAGPGPKLDGPILHTFFGWRVFPNMKVELKRVEPSRGLTERGNVTVSLHVNGAPREVIVSVSEDCWAGSATVRYCIDDLRYDSGPAYKAYLASLAQP